MDSSYIGLQKTLFFAKYVSHCNLREKMIFLFDQDVNSNWCSGDVKKGDLIEVLGSENHFPAGKPITGSRFATICGNKFTVGQTTGY